MNITQATRRRQLGFTIIETLISLVIMGFGILSLAGMQAAVSRNSDDARQRTEAVRLAQEKIEALRSFTGITSTIVGQGITNTSALNWGGLVSGNDSITTNAAYTRTWTLGGSVNDPMRGLTVKVDWTDRAAVPQSISLSSVLSKTNPADSGFLGFPLPLNTNLKRPKNRNLDIPIPAIDLGDVSAVKFGTSNEYVLFGNISGEVVKMCTASSILTSTSTTAEYIAALSPSTCTDVYGYIVAGYVSRDTSVSNNDWDAIKNGLGIDHSGITRNAAGSRGISCQFGPAVNQNTGALIVDYRYYLCVVPLSAPSPALTTNGPYNWSGTVRIAGPALWNGNGNKYFVCRYQYNANTSLTDANQRNVQPYQAINKSIDQQNYLIVTTNNATDTLQPICPTSMNTGNVATGVLHQDCRSASNLADHTTACPLLTGVSQQTLTYNGNGNTGGLVPVDINSPYNAGSAITVLGNSLLLSKTSYTFNGWNTLANGTGTAYTAGARFSLSGNTVLYAQWTNAATYSITYNGNNNQTGTVPLDINSPYTTGSVVTVLGNTGALGLTGSTFNGWNTASNGSGTAYAVGSLLTIGSSAITLYAQWYQAQYTVIYNGNGYTGGAVPTDGTPYNPGVSVTVLGAGTLSKTNSTFAEWNTASNGTGTRYAAGAQFNITATTRLYAQWTSLVLGTPAPIWTNQVLSWPAISNATAYLVSSCTNAGTAGLVTCTPIGAVSQTALFITPALSNKDTRCYTIIATGLTYLQSAPSSRRCINLQGNNYTYQ
jgi:type II secretory pathway pseudopilin PulG